MQGSNETAIHFIGGKEYEGYLFVQSERKATVRIALLCTTLGRIGEPSAWKTLGSAELEHEANFSTDPRELGAAGGNATVTGVLGLPQGWSMLNFTITAEADCLHGGSGDAAGQGLISIALKDGMNVAIDKIMVEPGSWGRR